MNKISFSAAFLIMFLTAVSIFPQEFTCRVRGVVVDRKTHKGIPGVNVFLSETTWGTTTDSYGIFEIKNLPPGNHEIVVSIIGFEVVTKNFTLKKNEAKELDFSLNEKVYELETVEVSGERPANWDNNLAIFKNYFIGQSNFAKHCSILNEEQLSFSEGANKELYAEAEKPLIVANNALGYKIEIVLVNFKWDTKEGRVQYSIKPKFTEMVSENDEQKNMWIQNRDKAYYGSVNHFLLCLKENTFNDNGYKIYLVPRLNRNPQFVAALSDQITRSTQLLKPGMIEGEDVLSFGDRLSVEYSRIPSELEISWVDLNYREITIDEFGYAEEFMPFQTIGYWAKLGIADWLPKYYGTVKQLVK